jgi:hypothetical protein
VVCSPLPLEGITLTSLVDIVKLCVQAVDINDSLELGLYVCDYQRRMEKPITAVAMGPNGQMSCLVRPSRFHHLAPSQMNAVFEELGLHTEFSRQIKALMLLP